MGVQDPVEAALRTNKQFPFSQDRHDLPRRQRGLLRLVCTSAESVGDPLLLVGETRCADFLFSDQCQLRLRLAALPGPLCPQPPGQSAKSQSGHGCCRSAFGVCVAGGSGGGSAMGAGDRHAHREVPRRRVDGLRSKIVGNRSGAASPQTT